MSLASPPLFVEFEMPHQLNLLEAQAQEGPSIQVNLDVDQNLRLK